MEHRFIGPAFTVGIEEELMILDPQTLELTNSIEAMLEATGGEAEEVKPELMESVLEIATKPCASIAEVARELPALRARVQQTAEQRDLAIGSAGTHPYAMWEDQRIAQRQRYRDIVAALRFVARQELIFGAHVHVGIDDPDKAVYVANGMRVHLALLLALSANSPFWRADTTGMHSTRTPIFRAFPRVGIPPYYRDWEEYVERVGFMVDARVIDDYTYLWYDVRPHPNIGTVEVRVLDAQTRVEHTVALAALIQAMVKELAEQFDEGRPLADCSFEMLDENKWLAARHGLDGELVDLPSDDRISTRELVRRTLERLADQACDLGSTEHLAGIEDLLERGNGAARQLIVYEANHDFAEVMREIIAKTTPT